MKPIAAFVYAMLLVTGLTWTAAAGADSGPDALIKTTTDEVLAVIKQTSDPQKLVQVAQTKVLPHFDFQRMTRLAVGRGWATASPQQQQALEKEFRELLVRTYTHALATGKGKDATVTVTPLRTGAGDNEATVKTQVRTAGEKPIPIDYQMENTPSGWKIFDVAVDGISLVTNYRESFAAEISKSGIDGLLKLLTAKNRTRDAVRS